MTPIESISYTTTQADLSVTVALAKGSLSRMGMGTRIRAVREHFDLTQQEFADKLAVSRGAVGNWERDMGLKFANLAHIAKVFGVSVDWLSTEKGPMFGFDDEAALAHAVGEEDGTARVGNGKRIHLKANTIPEFDLRAGMSYGGGYAIEAQISDGDQTYSAEAVRAEWGIPPTFLQGELRLSPARTHVLAVDGPSMVPDLMPGDRVLIDLTHTDPRQGGIFAVREDGGVIIKHVEIVRGSDPPRIICKSSNQTYSPFELILDGDKVAIIGRVAGRISRM